MIIVCLIIEVVFWILFIQSQCRMSVSSETRLQVKEHIERKASEYNTSGCDPSLLADLLTDTGMTTDIAEKTLFDVFLGGVDSVSLWKHTSLFFHKFLYVGDKISMFQCLIFYFSINVNAYVNVFSFIKPFLTILTFLTFSLHFTILQDGFISKKVLVWPSAIYSISDPLLQSNISDDIVTTTFYHQDSKCHDIPALSPGKTRRQAGEAV